MLRLRHASSYYFFFQFMFAGGFPCSSTYHPRRARPAEIKKKGEEPSEYLCIFVASKQVEAWSCTACSFVWAFSFLIPTGEISVGFVVPKRGRSDRGG
ncbi:hypothetical protein F4814DRAFT_30986 [Daldinia grandis]|nr:hypothetical protein F4814DRAFT_30986 [Daldinia grandis]